MDPSIYKKDGLFYLDNTNLVSLHKDYKPNVKDVPQANPMEAAKSVISGLVKQNPELLSRVMWSGVCDPAVGLAESPNAEVLAGMSMKDIHFEKAPGENTISVDFKRNGKTIKWNFQFKEGKGSNKGRYYLFATDIFDKKSEYFEELK